MTIVQHPDERDESWLRGWRKGRLAGLEEAAASVSEELRRARQKMKSPDTSLVYKRAYALIAFEAACIKDAIRALMEKPDA